MMTMNEWDIKGRSEQCARTGRPFVEGETFYTLLYHDKAGYRREDLCEQAWNERNENIQPFSFWRSKFEPAPPPAPEALAKDTAEGLLRRYMQEQSTHHANARYILALMLERKRILKQIDVQETGSGRTLIYEHGATGEVFLIPDPQLRLDQIAAIQQEVAQLIAHG